MWCSRSPRKGLANTSVFYVLTVEIMRISVLSHERVRKYSHSCGRYWRSLKHIITTARKFMIWSLLGSPKRVDSSNQWPLSKKPPRLVEILTKFKMLLPSCLLLMWFWSLVGRQDTAHEVFEGTNIHTLAGSSEIYRLCLTKLIPKSQIHLVLRNAWSLV